MSSPAISTPVRPSTPISRSPSTPSTPQTGTWRHPKLDEIVRRQNASTFSDRNFTTVLYNFGVMVGIWALGNWLWKTLPNLFLPSKILHPYATWIYYLLQLALLSNIILACLPLFRGKDDIQDIPLTPAQRKLLGLPPSSKPATPDTKYVTPPRYPRNSTPMSGSPLSKGSHSNSPLSRKESPGLGSLSGSPFSPSASPLLQKAIGGGLDGNRRHSYGSPSPLGPGVSRINLEAPGTPSPAGAKAPTVGLNSKWLFDKGRRNSGSTKLYS